MNGGMTGVMKEGTGDEERQMDHHDITLECAYVCVCVCVCVDIHFSSYFPAMCLLN